MAPKTYKTVLEMGIAATNAAEKFTQMINETMDSRTFGQFVGQIRNSETRVGKTTFGDVYPWDIVLLHLIETDRPKHIEKMEGLITQKVLNNALQILIAAEPKATDRETAQTLMNMGANANADSGILELDPSDFLGVGDHTLRLHKYAYEAGRSEILEPMIVMTPRLKGGEYLLMETTAEGMKDIHALAKEKDSMRGLKPNRLRDAYRAAVSNGDIPKAMAAYAESRRVTFLRGTVSFNENTGGDGILMMARNNRFAFAKAMIMDGYDPEKTSFPMQDYFNRNATAEQKARTESLKPLVKKVAAKRQAAAEAAARAALYQLPPF